MPVKGINVDVSGSNAYISYDYPVNITPISESITTVGPIGSPGLPTTPGTGGITGTAGGSNASSASVTAANIIAPSINVLNQAVVNGTITVAEVASSGPGLVAIYNSAQGQPYILIGYSPVSEGISKNVAIRVNTGALTGTLYATLYLDLGRSGVLEYPGPDIQQRSSGHPVLAPFEITNLGQVPPDVQPSAIEQTLSGIGQSPASVL